jgi:mevalonate kinase
LNCVQNDVFDMSKIITVSAPGKVFLMGEHAVVYGKPALQSTIDKRCVVTLTQHNKKTLTITSTQVDTPLQTTLDDMVAFTQQARKTCARV